MFPMNSNPRYLAPDVEEDLREKMVFLSGPRQVGKTTLAESLLAKRPGLYLNWDREKDRASIRAAAWPLDSSLIVLDEIHKYRKWKGWLKGEYDHHRGRHAFLVTGSARLSLYRKGGDSLMGRYYPLRLHPFSVAEAVGLKRPPRAGDPLEIPTTPPGAREAMESLLRFGGFPEPFLRGDERRHRRWLLLRKEQVLKEDVRDVSNVSDLSSLQILADLLPGRVGSPLSLNSLREDLQAGHRAVSHWVEIFEQLYFCHRVPPFAGRLATTLRKERKAYLWDWSAVEAPGPRFENMVAGHLLKLCHYLKDVEGRRAELQYLRDRSGREVDFLVALDGKPWFAVEVKLSPDEATSLRYFGSRLAIPRLFLVYRDGPPAFEKGGVFYVPADRFLSALGV
jgi:uncharacterized protein